jgi:hypothetical protein
MEISLITKPKRTKTPFTAKDSMSISKTVYLNKDEINPGASIYLTGIRFCRVYQQEIRIQRQKRSNFSINDDLIKSKTGSDNTILDVVSYPNIGHSRSAELAHLDELPYLFELNVKSDLKDNSYRNFNSFDEALNPVAGLPRDTNLVDNIKTNSLKFQTILIPSMCNLNYTRLGWFGCVSWDQTLQAQVGKFEDVIPPSFDISFTMYDYKHLPLNLIPEIELKFTIM